MSPNHPRQNSRPELFPYSLTLCMCSKMPEILLICFLLQISMGFPHSLVGRESTCNAGDPGLIPGSGRSAGEGIGYPLQFWGASLVAQLIKNLPAIEETWVQSLGWEDPLEKGKLPTSVFWPGEFHGRNSSWGCKESDTSEGK